MAASFLSKVVSIFISIIVLMLYAHMIPALDRLGTALLASVSVASIVIGPVAQSTLANFVAGLSLIFYRPFRLGDRVQVNAPSGLATGIAANRTSIRPKEARSIRSSSICLRITRNRSDAIKTKAALRSTKARPAQVLLGVEGSFSMRTPNPAIAIAVLIHARYVRSLAVCS
jgi:hypothetical protein